MNIFKNYIRKKSLEKVKTTFLSKDKESWAIITGCTSGIGKSYAEILSKNGFSLILIARNELKLNNLASQLFIEENQEKLKLIKCDFSIDELYTNTKFQEYLEIFKDLNIKLLINNVGQSSELGEFYNFEISRHKAMINTNINSHIFMSQLFIQSQKGKSDEQYGIINISSYFGTRAVPGVALYSASKSFLKTFSECVKYETNMKVLCVNPLFVKTNMVRFKENFFVIKPEDVVYSSFIKMSKNNLFCNTYCNIKHLILAILFNLIPGFIFNRYSIKYYRGLYNKLKRK
jgi:17beta-estradiol 17-dehydrogenase / very-long-chain 3-oxoacyl-CoA reductase